MTTMICAAMVRDRTPGMFADLTDATWTASRANGLTTLTFDAELDAETVAAIRDRMVSHDEAGLEGRALNEQRDLVVSLREADPVDVEALVVAAADLAVLNTNYLLGD